ncbi:MAG TPA: type VI secretion system protein TssA [Candidatus Competibacter sp.]|nr:type VI secretion system protein TssA [Candidatus Competibacter sp.]HRW64152.1 type VI secretion system protein TssA [Candidatus Competibacter sp.]
MSVIELEALLSDVAADTPCGEDLEYDPLFAEMEKLAQETPERQYGDTIIPAEPPDWRGVKKAALTLLERTRDLRVAVYLARALLQGDGFPGFAEGLALVEGLIERYWDGVYPLLDPDDDNDPTLRINTIVALCDSETTLRDLRETPLVSSRAIGRFSLRDVQVATGVLTPVAGDDEELPTQSRLDAAFQDADLEVLQATAEAVADARDRVERIEATLTDQVGVTQAPDMSDLTGVLKEVRQVLTEQLQRRGVSATGETEGQGESEDGASSGVAATGQRLVVGDIASREDVIRMLDKICDYFSRYEPSSPVPFLLKRAKNLVTKDFMEIMLDLAPGGTEQANLIFGLQSESSSEYG